MRPGSPLRWLLGACLLAPPLPALASPLTQGRTLDFRYDALPDTHHHEESYRGRLFLTAQTPPSPQPLPLVVFLHGLNRRATRYHFAGGHPDTPDVRAILADLVADGSLPPVIVGAPTTVLSARVPRGMWPGFDLDRFVLHAARTLRDSALIDLDRVIVVGHSAGGCNPDGGLLTALHGTSLHLRAVIAIDTCLSTDEARLLATAPAGTDVLVSFQPFTWSRPFDTFRTLFSELPPPAGSRRLLDELRPPNDGHAHNAMVALTLRKHLRTLLSPLPSVSDDPPTR